MPSFLGYIEKKKEIPSHLAFSIASLLAFYTGSEIRDKALIGHRDGKEYNILDDMKVLEFFKDNSGKETREYVHAVLSETSFWDEDLSKIPGVEEKVTEYLSVIRKNGMRAAMEQYFA